MIIYRCLISTCVFFLFDLPVGVDFGEPVFAVAWSVDTTPSTSGMESVEVPLSATTCSVGVVVLAASEGMAVVSAGVVVSVVVGMDVSVRGVVGKAAVVGFLREAETGDTIF